MTMSTLSDLTNNHNSSVASISFSTDLVSNLRNELNNLKEVYDNNRSPEIYKAIENDIKRIDYIYSFYKNYVDEARQSKIVTTFRRETV